MHPLTSRLTRCATHALLAFSSATLLAQQVSTTASVSVSPANPTTAESVSFFGSVSPSAACQASSSGFVFSWTGPNLAGQYQLPNACPSYNIGKLAAGTYTLQGYYLGSPGVQGGAPGYLGSQSPVITFTVVAPGGTGGPALQGQYAFLLQGAVAGASAGQPAAAIGSFTADGQGNITAGTVDVVTSTGAFLREPLTGSYTLATSGRGQLNLSSTSLGQAVFVLTTQPSQATSSLAAATATAISGPLLGAAQVVKQENSAANAQGVYLLDLQGSGQSNTLVTETGSLYLPGAGPASVSGLADLTQGGAVSAAVAYSATASAADPTTGIFSISSFAQGSPTTVPVPGLAFDAIQVDSSHLFLIQTAAGASTGSVLSGTAVQ